MLRRALTQRQNIQRRSHHETRHQANQNNRPHARHSLPRGAVQRTHLPEHNLITARRISNEHEERDNRIRHCGHRNTRQNHRQDLRATRRTRQEIHQRSSRQRTHKRKRRSRENTEELQVQHNRQTRANRRTRGNTNHARLSQRVTKHRLHHRAGSTQSGTHQHAQQHTRETDIPQSAIRQLHRRVLWGKTQTAAHRSNHLINRDVVLTQTRRQHHHSAQRHRQKRKRQTGTTPTRRTVILRARRTLHGCHYWAPAGVEYAALASDSKTAGVFGP